MSDATFPHTTFKKQVLLTSWFHEARESYISMAFFCFLKKKKDSIRANQNLNNLNSESETKKISSR